MSLYGGIEAGGTKFVCVVGTGPDDIRAEARFPTATPGETIERCLQFFRAEQGRHGPVCALGIGAFGPVDPDPGSPTWGYITSTPKTQWVDTDLAGPLRAQMQVPVGFDTDVNAAAFGEGRWGAAAGLSSFVYFTVGTGIGGGAVAGGRLVHGMTHPEMGHMRVPRQPEDRTFDGICPYHGDCLEGLASGPAIQARWGAPAETLSAEHPAWGLEARYLAYAVANVLFVLSPERVILGGGVMQQTALFPRIRGEVRRLLGEYVRHERLEHDLEEYVVPPALGSRAGVCGALALAEAAAHPAV